VRDCGLVGERANAAIIYLALTSRLLEDQLVSLAVKGLSSSGKSYALEKTLEFFPEDAVVKLSSGSDRALVYSKREYAHRTLIVYEATGLREGNEESMLAYFVRTLLSEGHITYEATVIDKDAGGFTTKVITKRGPTNMILTTTKVRVHGENETRLLSLSTDDSPEQTRRVMFSIACEDRPAVDLEEWRYFQAWLATQNNRVSIPYAATLASMIPPAAVRLRRDFGQLLALVRAHAVLHQQSRERDASGRIVASLRDYRVVRRLVEPTLAGGVARTVHPVVRTTVEAVEQLTDGWETASVSAQQAAAKLEVDVSAAHRRLRRAASEGYLVNEETRPYQPGRWRRVSEVELPSVDTGLLPFAWQLANALDRESAGQDRSEGSAFARLHADLGGGDGGLPWE